MSKYKYLILTGGDKEELIESLIKKNIELSGVLVPKSEKYRKKYERTVLKSVYNNIKIICSGPKEINHSLSEVNFDVLLSCGYPFVIPKEVFSKAKYAINFHPTLLPKNRGKYVHYILINNEEFGGITAHFIDEGLDTGDIIKKISYPVSPFDTVKSLLRKSAKLEIELVAEIIAMIESDQKLESVPQDNSIATTYLQKRTLDDSMIDPSKPLLDLIPEIRAFDPTEYPAFFIYKGEKLYINIYRKDKNEDEFDMI